MKYLLNIILFFTVLTSFAAKNFEINSPDGKIHVSVLINNGIKIDVQQNGRYLFSASNIEIHLLDGRILGIGNVKRSDIKAYNHIIKPVLKEKVAEIIDSYMELKIDFKESYTLLIRVYNNGVSYRFITNLKKNITIVSEKMEVKFQGENEFYYQESESFNSSYETPYQHKQINDISIKNYIGFPFLAANKSGSRILLTESDLEDYPGMWIKKTETNTFRSIHAGYPIEIIKSDNAYRDGQVKKHASFIAKTNGSRSFPWRLFAIAENDADLLTNTLVYQLAKPLQIKDPSWIKSGVVTFDWWGKMGVYGTDFKAGVNTATAKYFIDFAEKFGFEYFLFDDGWTDQGDLSIINPELDMEEIITYAKSKNIKIMLWAIWSAFEKDWEGNFDRFEKWGISGIKFDFMNRDDQKMVQFYHKAAKEAAKRKMVLNFHGAYKPSGLRRAYPNIITREGLIEFEYNGVTTEAHPDHHNLLPYLRMVTGPMDYIPYTTNNAQKKDFRPISNKPMGQGTRAHSMALSIILESPMRMLPDSPSDYYRELECTEFYSKLPVVWDDIKVLEAKVGDYTIVARRSGKDWYIGAITDWKTRDFELSFNFLGDGNYKMEYIKDGVNADTTAKDYEIQSQSVTNVSKIKIHLVAGGGWLARIIK
ncbi:MAG: glycoside hydrolase family 97 protein [Bacteroidetes bacterium]|nr:MAG: glycoside hydrolase family 97 protein [Bacteroidota bacterium]